MVVVGTLERPMNRRDIIKAIGTSTVTIAAGTGAAAAMNTDAPDGGDTHDGRIVECTGYCYENKPEWCDRCAGCFYC